MPVVKVC